MTLTAPLACEVKTEAGWIAVSLKEARGRYGFEHKRCPSCHGRVVVAGTYNAEGCLILQHHRSHDGCPLQPARFKGVRSTHPQALA